MVVLCWTKWSPKLKNRKTFKWHLCGQRQDFKINSHHCSSYAPLPKLLKMGLLFWTKWLSELKIEKKALMDRISRWIKWLLKNIWTFFSLMVFWRFHCFNLVSKISEKLFKPFPCHKFQYLTVMEICCMPSAYLQWRFHSGEQVVTRGPLVYRLVYCAVKIMFLKRKYILTSNT